MLIPLWDRKLVPVAVDKPKFICPGYPEEPLRTCVYIYLIPAYICDEIHSYITILKPEDLYGFNYDYEDSIIKCFSISFNYVFVSTDADKIKTYKFSKDLSSRVGFVEYMMTINRTSGFINNRFYDCDSEATEALLFTYYNSDGSIHVKNHHKIHNSYNIYEWLSFCYSDWFWYHGGKNIEYIDGMMLRRKMRRLIAYDSLMKELKRVKRISFYKDLILEFKNDRLLHDNGNYRY